MSERTETIETVYGETTIDLVECDSCGAEVARDGAEPFEIGDRSGWACPHCVDKGPVSFPRQVQRSFGFGVDAQDESIVAELVFFPLVATFALGVLADDLDTDDTTDMWMHGFATAIWGLVLWCLVLGLLAWVVA